MVIGISEEGLLYSLLDLNIKLPWDYKKTLHFEPDPEMVRMTLGLRKAFRDDFERRALGVMNDKA